MSDIQTYLQQILDASKGDEVRDAIHDSIEQCYTDGRAGSVDMTARSLIESVIAVNEEQETNIGTLESRVDALEGGGSSSDATTTTVNGCIIQQGIVDSVSVANNAIKHVDVTFPEAFSDVPYVAVCLSVQSSGSAYYADVQVGLVKSGLSATGFRYFLANKSGSSRTPTVEWMAILPTDQTINTDIIVPSGEVTEERMQTVENALDGIKTGYDGTVYETAGGAVRQQISDLHVLIGDEEGTAISASAISYDNTDSGMSASNVQDAVDSINAQISDLGSGVSTSVRTALYTLLSNMTFDDNATYTDELAVIESWATECTAVTLSASTASISGSSTVTLTATTTPTGGTVTWTSSDTAVATVADGVVTGVGNGTVTITASCGDISATCTVTVSGFAELLGITATYTQSGTVYNTDSLSDLVSDLVVTANYDDSTTATITSDKYALSGTLSAGTSTITVTYGGKTATFNVTVTDPTVSPVYKLATPMTADGTIDYALFTEDADYTIAFTVTTPANSGNVSFSNTANGSNRHPFAAYVNYANGIQGIQIWDNATKIQLHTAWLNGAVAGEQRCLITHDVDGDTVGYWYHSNMKSGHESSGQGKKTLTSSIGTHTEAISTSGIAVTITGDAVLTDFTIYKRVLNNDEISEYMGWQVS